MSQCTSDRHLAQRALDGEDAAWRELYTNTRGKLFALLVYHLGDRDEALDVLQDVYMVAVQNLDSYRGEGSLESWLCGIALRRARDWKRRFLRRFKKTSDLDQAGRNLEARGASRPDIGVHIRRGLAELPARQREAVLLHEYMGYSFREVGERMGIAEATARVHAHRGREALKKRLDPQAMDERGGSYQEQES